MKRDGGPAFPRIDRIEPSDFDVQEVVGTSGMTLRDWFAGQALIGFLSAPSDGGENGDAGARARGTANVAAAWAYEQADAMIAARDGAS